MFWNKVLQPCATSCALPAGGATEPRRGGELPEAKKGSVLLLQLFWVVILTRVNFVVLRLAMRKVVIQGMSTP